MLVVKLLVTYYQRLLAMPSQIWVKLQLGGQRISKEETALDEGSYKGVDEGSPIKIVQLGFKRFEPKGLIYEILPTRNVFWRRVKFIGAHVKPTCGTGLASIVSCRCMISQLEANHLMANGRTGMGHIMIHLPGSLCVKNK